MKMNLLKSIVLAMYALVSVVGVANADYEVQWQTPGTDGVYSWDGSGWLAGYDGLWTAVLYISDNNELPAAAASSFDFATWNAAPGYSDQSVMAQTPVLDFGDTFGSVAPSTFPSLNVNSNQYLYTVVWNGTTPGSADRFVILEDINAFDVPSVDPFGPQSFVYQTGTSAPNGSDWVAVPEPTTLALFGIGLVGMLVRKVSKK